MSKTSEARLDALKRLQKSKEILSKKEVVNKLKKFGDIKIAKAELAKKGIYVPKTPTKVDLQLGDITRLQGPSLGRKYAEFVEYYSWLASELAMAEIDESNGDIIHDHTCAVVLLEDIIQSLTSREDREAASKSHRETSRALLEKGKAHTKAHMLRAICAGVLKKVDALSREITRRQGYEKHDQRQHRTH